ncbi:MAG: prephenate dehydratase [Alphaproteobacteria bacterium]|nr:prephenate dehydratase [Alphaproteobacteria bacterium]
MSQPEAKPARDPAHIVAFQGMPGANSHIMCAQVFPDFEAMPCRTFEDAFAAVREGRASYGMIPIENSVAGRVADIHRLLPESGLFIIGEQFLRVRYQLMAPEGASIESLKRVFSHVQALAQCKNFIRDLGLEAIVHEDTAGAAKDVAARNDPAEAAIAPPLAAEIYGLKVLRSHIEDVMGNTTRFVVMARRPNEPDPKAGHAMTSFVFQVRNVPAALYKAMGGFATNGVNMVKLESYMTDNSFTATQFYAEIEGHPADKHVERALEELQFFSTKLKILGVYPRSDFRGNA